MPTERKTQPRKTAAERITDLESDSTRADKSDARSSQIEYDADALKLKLVAFDGNLVTLLKSADKTERALWGSNGDIGMAGRLSKVEDVVADIKKLIWALIIIIVGLAVGAIWETLLHPGIPLLGN